MNIDYGTLSIPSLLAVTLGTVMTSSQLKPLAHKHLLWIIKDVSKPVLAQHLNKIPDLHGQIRGGNPGSCTNLALTWF